MMNNQLMFTASSEKNEVVISPNLGTTKVSVQFLRFKLMPSSKVLKELAPTGFPRFAHFNWAGTALDNGYLYIYHEKKASKDKLDGKNWSEYRVQGGDSVINAEGESVFSQTKFYKVKWEDNNYRSCDTNSIENKDHSYIQFDHGDIVWVAFSAIQWSASYLKRIMSDASFVKNRFQKLDIDDYVRTCDNIEYDYQRNTSRSAWSQDKENGNNSLLFHSYSDYDNSLHQSNKLYEYHLNTAIESAQDIIDAYDFQIEQLALILDNLATGTNPYDENSTCPDYKAFKAMFDTAQILYPLLYDGKGSFKKYAKHVQEGKIKKVLGIEQRKALRSYLIGIRKDLHRMILSNFYQNTLLDYLDNTEENKAEGQFIVINHQQKLGTDPVVFDPNLDLPSEAPNLEKNEITMFVKRAFFGEDTLPDTSQISPKSNSESEIQLITRRLLVSYIDLDKIKKDLPLKIEINRGFQERWGGNTEDFVTQFAFISNKILYNVDSVLTFYSKMVKNLDEYNRLHQIQKNLYARENLVKNIFIKRKVNLEKAQMELLDELNEFFKKSNLSNHVRFKNIEELSDAFIDYFYNRKLTREELRNSALSGHVKPEQLDDLADAVVSEKVAKGENTIEGLKKRESVIISKIEDAKSKNIDLLRRTDIELNEFDRSMMRQEFQSSQNWRGVTIMLSVVNLGFSINNLASGENQNELEIGTNIGSIVSSSTDMLSLLAPFISGTKAENWIFNFFGAKNRMMTLSMRIGYVGMGFSAAVDIAYSIQRMRRLDHDAAAAYLVSAACTVGALYSFHMMGCLAYAGGVAGPVGVALVVVGIAAAFAAAYLTDNDIEAFLKQCVFTNVSSGFLGLGKSRRIDTTKDSHLVAQELYERKKDLAFNDYKGVNYNKINLQDFTNMMDVAINLTAPVEFDFRSMQIDDIEQSHKLYRGEKDTVFLKRFKLAYKFYGAANFAKTFEQEIRIYPYGTEYKNDWFLIGGGEKKYDETQVHYREFRYYINNELNSFLEDKKSQKVVEDPSSIIIENIANENTKLDPVIVFMGYFKYTNNRTYPLIRDGKARYFGMKSRLIQKRRALSVPTLLIYVKIGTEDEILSHPMDRF